jgi:hypothetical protein
MNSIQYVEVKVKLANLTMASPNDTTVEPSPIASLVEFQRVIANNETWEFPLSWAINDAYGEGDMIYIRGMTVNNESITPLDTGAQLGGNFRIIIELWTFNPDQNNFVFGWSDNGARRCAWLQFWFNETSTS